MRITNDVVSPECVDKSISPAPPERGQLWTQPAYVATSGEAVDNYRQEPRCDLVKGQR